MRYRGIRRWAVLIMGIVILLLLLPADLYASEKHMINLSEEEKEFVEKSDPVRVAVFGDRYPLNYMYDGKEKGIIRDVISLIAERTGITFEFVIGNSYQEMIDLVQNGEADITGYFLDDSAAARDMGFQITAPYAETNEVIVKNDDVDYPSEDLTFVLPKGRSVPDYIEARRVIYVVNYSECIRAINKGEGDFTCVPFIFAEAAFHQENISNITVMALNNRKTFISFALPQSSSEQLYSIMNKAIDDLSEDEIGRIIESNQLSMKGNEFSMDSFIHAHPFVFTGVVVTFVILISVIIVVILRARMKHELMLAEMKQAETINAAKSEILSRMSYNLRIPMNTITGLVKLIRITGEVTPDIEDKLEKIDASSQYLFSQLNNILDIYQIKNRNVGIQVAPFRMDRMMRQLKYMMYLKAEEKGVFFDCLCDVNHNVVIGDALKIQQIVVNMLENALKYTKKGGKVIFRVEEMGERENTASLYFSVKDSGIGIQKEDIGKIFETFGKAGNEREDVWGTGLGLPISDQLARLMGSEIKVESTPGKGTEFFFILKLPIGREEDIKEDSVLKQEMMKHEPEEGEFKGLKVLMAEDNEANAEIIINLLTAQGVCVEHAVNGRMAVDMYRSRPEGYYDIALMDIQMPEMTGLDAVRVIRSLRRKDSETLPIAAMTADTTTSDRMRTREAGMNDFIAKPFEMGEIYRIFRKYKAYRDKK